MQKQLNMLTKNYTPRTQMVRKLFRRINVSKYCWTHGACAHISLECHNKKVGYVDHATFDNKCRGSTFYCPEIKNAQPSEKQDRIN